MREYKIIHTKGTEYMYSYSAYNLADEQTITRIKLLFPEFEIIKIVSI
jgi:hypothetical protein